jgi:hypothetical protein
MTKLLWLIPLLCAHALAAPAYVQSTSNCSFGGTSNATVTVGGSGTTACPTGTGWTSNVTTGNLLAVAVWRTTGSATLNSVADGGDTCTAVNTAGTTGTSNAYVEYAGYCVNIAGGSKPTITLTFSNNEGTWYVVAHEVSGIAKSSPLDNSVFIAMGSTSAGTNAATTGNWTTNVSGDYIFCFSEDDATNGRTFSSGTTSQTWTTRFGPDNTHSESMITEDGIQATATSSTVCAFTTAGGLTNPLLGGMAFKAFVSSPTGIIGGHAAIGGKAVTN